MFSDIRDFLTLKSLKRRKEDIQEASDSSEEVRELLVYNLKAKSSLGWIVWKEKEASLIRLLERIFMAVKVHLEFTKEYNEFMIQVLAPSNQAKRISTYIKGGQLQDEIDKIHGAYKDVVLSFGITPGESGEFKGKSCQDVIQERVKALTDIDFTRKREINALDTQFEALRDHADGAMSDFEERYQKKLETMCLSKFDRMEKQILEIVDKDLKILRSDINERISD
jgi:hypothetical protein